MKCLNKYYHVLAAACLLFLLSLQYVPCTEAAEGLTISPPIVKFDIKEAQLLKQEVRLFNRTANPIMVYPKVMDFKTDGEGGDPTFFEATDNNGYSLTEWLKFDKSNIIVPPHGSKVFTYTVNTPSIASPGGHYGAIFFVNDPNQASDGSSGVAIGTMIAQLIMATVPGVIYQKGSLEEFTLDRISKPGVTFITRIKNIGNVHYAPKGTIQVTNLTGRQAYSTKLNEKEGLLLPESIRRFENSWKPSELLFGRYKVRLTIEQEGDKPIISEKVIWLMPKWLIAIPVLIFIALILYLKRRRKPRKMTPKTV